jgi:hypothetical protein
MNVQNIAVDFIIFFFGRITCNFFITAVHLRNRHKPIKLRSNYPVHMALEPATGYVIYFPENGKFIYIPLVSSLTEVAVVWYVLRLCVLGENTKLQFCASPVVRMYCEHVVCRFTSTVSVPISGMYCCIFIFADVEWSMVCIEWPFRWYAVDQV